MICEPTIMINQENFKKNLGRAKQPRPGKVRSEGSS